MGDWIDDAPVTHDSGLARAISSAKNIQGAACEHFVLAPENAG